MKFLAAILSVYILFLSMTANCADCCPEGDTCKTEQHEADNTSHDCQNPCSPFCICNICVGFIVDFFDYYQLKQQEISPAVNLYSFNIYASPFIKGIWQPPQSV
jgi:hypothetical protein